jgi:hypothetical protein
LRSVRGAGLADDITIVVISPAREYLSKDMSPKVAAIVRWQSRNAKMPHDCRYIAAVPPVLDGIPSHSTFLAGAYNEGKFF